MNNKKIFLIGSILLSIALVYYVIECNIGSRQLIYNSSNGGTVADAETAIKIAEAIGPIYFGEAINDYKPFQAKLEENNIWIVYGIPKQTWFCTQYGGSPVFEIQKTDCKILRVYISR